ncbi:hypothetical protein RDI58_003625 [Solanum bulbocastanum]
MRIKCC